MKDKIIEELQNKKNIKNDKSLEKEIFDNKIIDIDLSIISDILKQTGRKYLNIYRKSNHDIIDYDTFYCLSYIQLPLSFDIENIDYIKDILLKYIDFLNNKTNDKTIELSTMIVPEYEKGKSILLDVTSENWDKYKAGTLFVKNYIKRNIKGDNLFYLDEKELLNLLKGDEYLMDIFYLDRINQTFSFSGLIKFLKNLNTVDAIKEFFLDIDLDNINNLFLKKTDVGFLDLENSDNYYSFKNELSNMNISNVSIDDFALFITRKLLSLHFIPHPLINDNGNLKWNRKEILKKSKTEDKLNNTFANEIFDLALS